MLSFDDSFIQSIVEKYGNSLLKINLSNNGASYSMRLSINHSRRTVLPEKN